MTASGHKARTYAILLCAGRGTRLGAELPKALVPLAGRPLFTWSLEALQQAAPELAAQLRGAAHTAAALDGIVAGSLEDGVASGRAEPLVVAGSLYLLADLLADPRLQTLPSG